MKRIFLFLATNIAIMLVISVVFALLGMSGAFQGQGIDLLALLIISSVFGMSGSIISLLMSKWTAKRAMRVQIIEQPQNRTEQWLVDIIKQQAQRLDIDMPEVGIFHTDEINAFATGATRNSSLVAISTGLLQHMNEDEVEAVIGHEMSHVANGDMVTMALMQGVVNTFVYFFASVIGYIVDKVVLKNERGLGLGYHLTQIVAQIVLSFLATMLVMWFSRYREFRADAGGADLAGRLKMINALKALQRAHQPAELPGQLAAFGINGGGLKKLFSSHPPLAERIQALENNH